MRQDIASHSHHGHLRAVLVFAASFLLLTGGNAYAQGSVATDRAALVALYNATDGANWTNNTNWLSTEALSEWYGIRTDASDRVVQLSLIQNELSGKIPAALVDLTHLQKLFLMQNTLSGTIPVELGNMTSLLVLALDENELSGKIPVELGNMTSLQQLSLSQNTLSGKIPVELGKLANLQILYLWTNELSGTIPVELGKLTSLRHLLLWSNELSGTIPAELGKLTNLQILSLSQNTLSGKIPVELGTLTNLQWLYLNQNELSGEIPAELGNLASLQILYLWSNTLSGAIPVELGNLTNLQQLYLSQNMLSGPLPLILSALSQLSVLDIRSTNLCAPADTAFQAWLATITFRGAACSRGGGPRRTVPGAPASLTATAGDEEVALVWSAPADDGGTPVTGYEYRFAAGTTVPGDTPWQSAGLDLEWTVTGLTNGQQYAFEVRASNRVGEGEARGALATPVGAPGALASLTATAGDGEVALAWSAPADDGGAPITGYEYRHAAGTTVPGDTPWQSAGLDLERTVTGLTNGQQYAFEVRASNRVGEGEARGALATPVGAPGALASLTATAGDEEVVLAWSAPADDGGSPVTGYEYRYAAGDGVPDGTLWQDAGTELSTTVTGLENETRYAFEVRALNRVGPPGEASGTTALPLRLRAELFSSAASEGEALVVGVRRSGGLAFPAHAYIGVTDSALPGVTATEEGRDDGLGRHRLEFAAGAAEATVTVTVAFDGERRQDRVLGVTLDSAELEVDGVRRPYELVTPTLVVPVTEGDAGLSVADARVQGKSSVLAFTVSLDRTRDVAVRVDYATEDGSARAGEDYTPVSGTLVIEAGGREGTVEVAVLPALHVTGERTLTLRLSNAVSAVIDDGVATGTIVRESELPKAWLARFGRTASDHAAQAIARRLEAGQRETQVTVAGRRVDGLSVDGLLSGALPSGGWRPASAVEDMATRLAAPALAASRAPFGGVDADPGTPGLRAGTWGGAPGALDREPFADAGQTLRRAVLPDFGYRLPGAEEALLGTSFYVERGAQQDVGGGTWAAWGDVAATRFEGDAGGLALDGDVVTGTAGLDRQWRAVLVGLALSRSSGEGGYGTGAGTIASTLTSVHPYVQVRLGERAQVWGAAGWGRGGLEITPQSGAALEADLSNSMAAAGARAVLMGAGGLEIALRSDVLWTETSSDGTAALAEAVGTASRGRLMLEGAGQIQGLGGVVRPKVEGGVRYDGGDAETGRGFEVGGGLDWARGSLTLQVNGRMLIAHADESYEEWGYSGSLVYEPGADGLGLQMRVGSSAGASASGIRNLWALENASGLVRGGAVPFAQRFDAEVGYGIGRGTLWYPYFVADDSGQTRLGLKLSSGRTMGVGLEFGRRESVDLGPEDAMLLRGELRF